MPDLFMSECQRDSSAGAAAVTIHPWEDSMVQFVLVVITVFINKPYKGMLYTIKFIICGKESYCVY